MFDLDGAGRLRLAGCLLAVIVVLALGVGSDRACADIIKKEDLLRGITTTHDQCVAIQQALWLTVDGRDFCVRYYISTAGGDGTRPVVFLDGDSDGPIDSTTDAAGYLVRRAWTDPTRVRDEDTDDLIQKAAIFSKMAKTTAIYIGRIGDGGTSGNHLLRKTLLELHLMNAALNALRQRYGFEGYHLAGESGGARLMFGLVMMRHDIGCAVSGSGQLVPMEKGRSRLNDPGETFFDPTKDVAAQPQNPAERLIMIADPADQQVPEAVEQIPLLAKWRQAGRSIYVINVVSTDPNHHGVFEYLQLVTAGCVLGRSDPEIVRAASTIIRRNTEQNQSERDKAEARARAGAVAH